MAKKNHTTETDLDLKLVAHALDAVPSDLPRYQSPEFAAKHVTESGGSEGAVMLAKAIARFALRVTR